MINRILCGDAVDLLKLLESDYVDLTITSPPYDNLRTYNGYTFDFEEVAKELYRVTKQGGVVVWVVGDATIKGSETGTSFKQALYFREIGFNLHDTMIYYKTNPVPYHHNRYNPSFEYMFVFSKGSPKTFNGLRVERKTKFQKNNLKRFRYPDGTLKEAHTQKETHDKLDNNVWPMSCSVRKTGHPAPFPEKLAENHILSWSNEGDVVLDPMCGSGTTLAMAIKNGRKYLGFDISQEYVDISTERVEKWKTQQSSIMKS